ncbi:hypothetical protein C0995_006753 [Termitomyces sp. Mi166|nr:hypothetical protein C0995_006753 [Termitomyces sp. Mi166\
MVTTVAAVVCWVDVVLARLSTFILLVAQGLLPRLSRLDDSNLLRSQREDDSLHAATQLPERWENITNVIGSSTASPAAIRLATRLLFAALIMAPQLNGEKQWADFRLQPQHVVSVILRNAERKYINGLSVDRAEIEYDDEERTSLAMLVIIFSSSKTRHASPSPNNEDTKPEPPVRRSANHVLPRYCSERSDDTPTITWLYHLNTPFCTNSSSECLAAFSFHFDSIISDEESHFGTIIIVIICYIIYELRNDKNWIVAQRQVPDDIPAELAVVLRKDKHLHIREKLDDASVRKIDLWDNNLSDVTASCLGIKNIICFLTLIWHGDLDDYISTSLSSSLISISKTMVLLGRHRNGRVIPILEAAILTFASITSRFTISGIQSSMEEELLFWDLAIQSEYTDFSIASSFAHRIMVTGGRNIDSLGLAEAWDHLRDVLLVILSGRFAEDANEALALLDSITSSPWTMTLRAELDSLITTECPSTGYFLALQQQLGRAGKAIKNTRWRLVHYYTPTGSHIVLVPPE